MVLISRVIIFTFNSSNGSYSPMIGRIHPSGSHPYFVLPLLSRAAALAPARGGAQKQGGAAGPSPWLRHTEERDE